MKRVLKSFAWTHTLTWTLALSLLSSFSGFAKLQAAPIPFSAITAMTYTPPPPPDRGAPGNRGEGASRGCTATPLGNTNRSASLMALVPEQTVPEQPSDTTSDATSITQVWGLTSTAYPRLWFSVPYAPNQISAIEFVLQNDQDQLVYRTPIAVPATSGVMSVQIPSTASGLEINQSYHWFFKVRVLCEPDQTPTLNYVEGWIQRTQLDQALSDRLTQATLQQQAELYAENGIWYDALTTLAQLKLAQPDNEAIAQEWTDLLTSVGLTDVATQPLIDLPL